MTQGALTEADHCIGALPVLVRVYCSWSGTKRPPGGPPATNPEAGTTCIEVVAAVTVSWAVREVVPRLVEVLLKVTAPE